MPPAEIGPRFIVSSYNWKASGHLIMLGFNDTSTRVRHFVSSPEEREKRDRRDRRK